MNTICFSVSFHSPLFASSPLCVRFAVSSMIDDPQHSIVGHCVGTLYYTSWLHQSVVWRHRCTVVWVKKGQARWMWQTMQYWVN